MELITHNAHAHALDTHAFSFDTHTFSLDTHAYTLDTHVYASTPTCTPSTPTCMPSTSMCTPSTPTCTPSTPTRMPSTTLTLDTHAQAGFFAHTLNAHAVTRGATQARAQAQGAQNSGEGGADAVCKGRGGQRWPGAQMHTRCGV
jgi:hypothetical protein